MINCEECKDDCVNKGKFDIFFVQASRELRELNAQKSKMTPDQYWEAIDVFYAKFPVCIMEALEWVIMDSYAKNGQLVK